MATMASLDCAVLRGLKFLGVTLEIHSTRLLIETLGRGILFFKAALNSLRIIELPKQYNKP